LTVISEQVVWEEVPVVVVWEEVPVVVTVRVVVVVLVGAPTATYRLAEINTPATTIPIATAL
jgi:hypothetical protein